MRRNLGAASRSTVEGKTVPVCARLLATTEEHRASLRQEFPEHAIDSVFGKNVAGWQVLPVDAPDFEDTAMGACELVVARDSRIGKVPTARAAGQESERRRKRRGLTGPPKAPRNIARS
jgi:hypothetical protein